MLHGGAVNERLKLADSLAQRYLRSIACQRIVHAADNEWDNGMNNKSATFDTTSAAFNARAEQRRRTWEIRRYENFDDFKKNEYRYWATQPIHVRLNAISAMTSEAYAMKGIHVRRIQRPHRAPE